MLCVMEFLRHGIVLCHFRLIGKIIRFLLQKNVHRFGNHHVSHRLEFCVLRERHTLRQLLRIGLYHGFPLPIPQVIERGDAFVLCQLIHDGIDEVFDIRLEIPVHLFSAGLGEPVRQLHEHGFHSRIVIGAGVDFFDHLRHQFPAFCLQCVPMLRLSFINAEQVLGKNILCEGGAQTVHALFREIAFVRMDGIGNQMHMGMMAFVVERRKPSEIFQWNFQVFTQRRGLCPQHIPPAVAVIKAQPFRVLTTQGEDRRPHIPRMEIQFLRYF